jgi:hypothetical protein
MTTTTARPAIPLARPGHRPRPPAGPPRFRKDYMMKAFRAAFAALPLLASLLLVPASANASTLESGTGSFTATGTVISVKHVDGNTIVTATEVQPLTGVLTGVRVAEGITIFHANGTFEAHDTGTFTGTVDGKTGTITISGASSGVGNTGDGTIVGYNGTGGLAGLHLQGTFQPMITGPTTAEGPIQVQYHFDS